MSNSSAYSDSTSTSSEHSKLTCSDSTSTSSEYLYYSTSSSEYLGSSDGEYSPLHTRNEFVSKWISELSEFESDDTNDKRTSIESSNYESSFIDDDTADLSSGEYTSSEDKCSCEPVRKRKRVFSSSSSDVQTVFAKNGIIDSDEE
ncbi:dentin sialophosphoprotein-like [Contarinia nasturtii]|uniref:dentin sialophosphoprotein-like n=1 Tax=Contarinia nasturtii TaxID=265458 RepID=UPI0012D3EBE5|nr:dentin sialophosphoprotein-like [Contarinia nasturtii]